MAVSHSTCPEGRGARLSAPFITLISDPCRWVSAATRRPRCGFGLGTVTVFSVTALAYLDFVRIIRAPEVSEAWCVVGKWHTPQRS